MDEEAFGAGVFRVDGVDLACAFAGAERVGVCEGLCGRAGGDEGVVKVVGEGEGDEGEQEFGGVSRRPRLGVGRGRSRGGGAPNRGS